MCLLMERIKQFITPVKVLLLVFQQTTPRVTYCYGKDHTFASPAHLLARIPGTGGVAPSRKRLLRYLLPARTVDQSYFNGSKATQDFFPGPTPDSSLARLEASRSRCRGDLRVSELDFGVE